MLAVHFLSLLSTLILTLKVPLSMSRCLSSSYGYDDLTVMLYALSDTLMLEVKAILFSSELQQPVMLLSSILKPPGTVLVYVICSAACSYATLIYIDQSPLISLCLSEASA